jgi:ABC-type Na+ efflux pump permease subunit
MRTFLAVFFKEILDNVRDRRTLTSALIMGPIFGPVMFAFVINLSIDRGPIYCAFWKAAISTLWTGPRT